MHHRLCLSSNNGKRTRDLRPALVGAFFVLPATSMPNFHWVTVQMHKGTRPTCREP